MNFHTTVSGQAMVTMIYHKKLDENWTAAAQKLRKALGACPSSSQPSVHIIGRSRKQKIELDAGHVIETLNVHGEQLTYKQVRKELHNTAHGRSAFVWCRHQDFKCCTGQRYGLNVRSIVGGCSTDGRGPDDLQNSLLSSHPIPVDCCGFRLKGHSVSQMEACARRCWHGLGRRHREAQITTCWSSIAAMGTSRSLSLPTSGKLSVCNAGALCINAD